MILKNSSVIICSHIEIYRKVRYLPVYRSMLNNYNMNAGDIFSICLRFKLKISDLTVSYSWHALMITLNSVLIFDQVVVKSISV